MAYAFVNYKLAALPYPGGQSTQTSGTAVDTTGNFKIAILVQSIGASPTTLTDSGGNSYTLIGEQNDPGGIVVVRAFYAKNITGNASATLAGHSTTGNCYCIADLQYSGIDQTNPLAGYSFRAQSAIGSVNANIITSGNFSTAATAGALFGICINTSHVARTAPPGAGTSPIVFTGGGGWWNNFATNAMQWEDAAIASAGTYAATFGTTATNLNDNFVTFGAVFALAGGGVAPTGMNGGEMLMGVGQ